MTRIVSMGDLRLADRTAPELARKAQEYGGLVGLFQIPGGPRELVYRREGDPPPTSGVYRRGTYWHFRVLPGFGLDVLVPHVDPWLGAVVRRPATIWQGGPLAFDQHREVGFATIFADNDLELEPPRSSSDGARITEPK